MKQTKLQIIKDGGVTSAQGFSACGVEAGIKYADRKDMAMIVSDGPAVAAGVFTCNQIKAAPVRLSMQHVSKGKARAIVANSGNANACTGLQGIEDAKETAALAAFLLNCKDTEVLICSTGRIGRPMPMPALRKGLRKAVKALSPDGGEDAAKAIMTSDTRLKQCAVKVKIDGQWVTVGGCAKGAGMIDPLMATMLCFLTTDAVIDRRSLQTTLRDAVDHSFNAITIDGDMSTNDTVLALASGRAGNNILRSYHKDYDVFQAAVRHVTLDLAHQIVMDGEGVTKFVQVSVKGAASQNEAKIAAESIANSALIKTSWTGNDPNWGRLMAALGYAGVKVKEELVDIYYDGLMAVRHGRRSGCPDTRLKAVAAKPRFVITVQLHLGQGEHTVYTSDLSEEYVRLNMSE